jgi:protein tyrosine/serine phosphatase
LRSDNLQSLTINDVDRLTQTLGVRDVIDLRSGIEIESEGPGPLTRESAVVIHHLSLYPNPGQRTQVTKSVLPWTSSDFVSSHDPFTLHYLRYLERRPDSIVTALRTIAGSRGAALVHCAAGKDRTGVICALALSVAGVDRDAIVADYVQSGERIETIIARLSASPTYAADLDGHPVDIHRPHPDAMREFLRHLDDAFGSPVGWLTRQEWTQADTEALRARLLAA